MVALFFREGGDYNSTSSHKRPLYPSNMDKQRDPPVKFHCKDEQALERLASHQTTDSRNYPDNMDSRKKDQDIKMYIFPGSTSFLLLLPQLWAYIN
jgi:serine/arginine repetitive matrix protein 1